MPAQLADQMLGTGEIGDGGRLRDLEADERGGHHGIEQPAFDGVYESLVLHGLTGDVDGDADAGTEQKGAIRLQFAQRLCNHPVVDGLQHLITLCARHEFVRTDDRSVRADHANETFETVDVVEVTRQDDLLRVHAEAAVGECVAQVADFEHVVPASHHARVDIQIDLCPVAAMILGTGAGHLGRCQRTAQSRLLRGQPHHAAAETQRKSVVGGSHRGVARGGEHLLGPCAGFVGIVVGHEHDEAVAADASRDHVVRQRRRPQQVRDAHDCLVAQIESHGVIDDMQPVDVQVQQRIDACSAGRAHPRYILFEGVAREQTGGEIVLALQQGSDLVTQMPSQKQLATAEIRHRRLFEEGEIADHLVLVGLDGNDQHLELRHVGRRRDLVGDQRLAAALHEVHEKRRDTLEGACGLHVDVHERRVSRMQPVLRHHHGAEAAFHSFDGCTQQLLDGLRIVRVRVQALGQAEQPFEFFGALGKGRPFRSLAAELTQFAAHAVEQRRGGARQFAQCVALRLGGVGRRMHHQDAQGLAVEHDGNGGRHEGGGEPRHLRFDAAFEQGREQPVAGRFDGRPAVMPLQHAVDVEKCNMLRRRQQAPGELSVRSEQAGVDAVGFCAGLRLHRSVNSRFGVETLLSVLPTQRDGLMSRS